MPSSPAPSLKPPKIHTTPRRRNRIHQAFSDGLSSTVVARNEGISASTCRGIRARWKNQDLGITRNTRGRKKKLSERDLRAFRRVIDDNPHIQLFDLCQTAPNVHKSTISRFLLQNGITHKRALFRPYLTSQNAERRLQWALEHRNKPLEWWRRVVFSDETSVAVGMNGKRGWVFLTAGMVFNLQYLHHLTRY